ncbi:universal stress protein [Nocardioides sp. SYSU D00038]|uniref:universal stress protein n=1 Tax=Nocardioides sp. SYSU D00038 TaxID=2812554 RepID=UPI001967A2F1|nr:universal stress protein [Nocardioides sp. SYSU D00038]
MTIVVGYVPNRHGEAALDAGLAEARLRGGDVVVVNATRGDALVDRRHLGDAAAAELEARLAGLDVPTSVRRVLGADVAEEVVRVADEVGAALVVIGLRHRSAVGKVLMGSVAQRVLLEARCPVLAVKAG